MLLLMEQNWSWFTQIADKKINIEYHNIAYTCVVFGSELKLKTQKKSSCCLVYWTCLLCGSSLKCLFLVYLVISLPVSHLIFVLIFFFFFFFLDFLHVARNIQKSRSISVEKGIIKINFQVFWKVLSFKFETIMKALIIFVFLFKTHFIYIQERYWLWYITQKCSQPIRMQDFLNLNTHEAMELWNYFFAYDSTLLELTNRFSFSAWFLLVIPNFGLTNQDSKIVEIAITQEKSELLNYFFA